MKNLKQITIAALVVLISVMLCNAADAKQKHTAGVKQQKKGAKSLFYDPNATGTVQISEPSASGGSAAAGRFTPSVSKMSADGTSVNPVSNYYDNLNPGVLYWVELVRPGSGCVKRVSNDRVFRSGDQIRIHITSNANGYLHVLHNGSTGGAQIMPVSNTSDGSVQMGQDYVVPSNGGWLRFDNNPGKEKLKLVFASLKSSDDIMNTMRRVSVQTVSTATDQLFGIYNQYSNSRSYITEVQTGSRDLLVQGATSASYSYSNSGNSNSGYSNSGGAGGGSSYQAAPIGFNTQGVQNYRVASTLYDAPASYTVSQSTGAVKEPVVIEITLNHHP